MKILYINPSNQWDGSTVALYRIVHTMKQRGHEVFVICSDIPGPFLEKLDKIDVNHFNHRISLSVYPKVRNPLKWIKRIIQLMYYMHQERKFICHIINKTTPDIVHTNVGPLDQAFDICKKMKIPHVWHQREYQDLDFGLHFFPSWAVYNRKLHDEINYNISITQNLFEYRNLRVGRDEVVYDGVFSLEQIEGLSNTKPKENYVFFAGRIQEAKGTYDLIKTYKEFHDKFPQIKLLIAGPYATSSNYYIKCKKYVLSNKLEDSVIFLGQRNDVYELMAKAKMLIVPSRFEGFGFITTEAMLNHCVVVGRNTAGTKEQFDNGLKEIGREIGFRFKTSKEMLNSMIKVMEEDTCQMEEDAYNVVKKLYSAEQNVDKIESLYKKILSNK